MAVSGAPRRSLKNSMVLSAQFQATVADKKQTLPIRKFAQEKPDMLNACRSPMILPKFHLMNCWKFFGKRMTLPRLTGRALMKEHNTVAPFFIIMQNKKQKLKSIKLNWIKVVLLTNRL